MDTERYSPAQSGGMQPLKGLVEHQKSGHRQGPHIEITGHEGPAFVEGNDLQYRVRGVSQAHTHVHDVVDDAKQKVMNDGEGGQHGRPCPGAVFERHAGPGDCVSAASEEWVHAVRRLSGWECVASEGM